jgi:hypothetical protein
VAAALLAYLRRCRGFRRHRNLDYVAVAIPKGIALVANAMVGSHATVDLVVSSFAIHAVNVVVAGAARHRIRTEAALQKVVVGVAVERIGGLVAIQLVAVKETSYEVAAATTGDAVTLVGAIGNVGVLVTLRRLGTRKYRSMCGSLPA